MLPPMRPKPTIPICMDVLSSAERLHDGLLEPRQAGGDIAPQMHADGAPSALVEHFEIASCSGVDHAAECVIASWHGNVEAMLGGDLKEDAIVRSPLIGLPRRVKEARTEADAGRHLFAVTDRRADVLQGIAMRIVLRHIGEERAIITVMGPSQMGSQRADQCRA